MKRIIITIITVLVTITANAQLKLHEKPDYCPTAAAIEGKVEIQQIASSFFRMNFDPITTPRCRSFYIGDPESSPLQTLLDMYNYCMKMEPGDTIEIEYVLHPIIMGKDQDGLTLKWHDNKEAAHLTSQEILYLYRELTKYMDAKRETPKDLP